MNIGGSRSVIAIISICAVTAGVLAVFGILQAWSYPGRPKPFLDEYGKPIPGSVSEKIRVEINGVEQGMFVRSKDATNPVLLYLHGGMPEYFLARRHATGLEDRFTVAWWEQRGSGISYSPDIPRETMTLDQLIADTIEVTSYLRERFRKDRIYLLGHSGGTFIGIHAAARAPELFHAYVGVAQMSYQLESEILAHDYMLRRFREAGNARMVRKLEAAPVTREAGASAAYRTLRDPAMHSLGVGTTHEMKSVFSGVFLPSLQCRDYTLREKVRTWRAKAGSGVALLWDEMLATDLSKEVPELAVPAYFLHGVHDYTCSYPLAKSYFDQLKAPVKGFYTFEKSAHSPMFEESKRTLEILRADVLAGKNDLADPG